MKKFGLILKEIREAKDHTLKNLSLLSNIDATVLSKIERSERKASKDQLNKLCEIYIESSKELQVQWLAERLHYLIREEPHWRDAMIVAEEEVEYKSTQKTANKVPVSLLKMIDELNSLKTKLDLHRDLDSYRIAEALEIEYTHDSNQIEGNTLTLQETNLVVHNGLTISGKSMREHLEAINHYDAIQYIKELVTKKLDINRRVLLELHHLVLRGIDKENAGRYRQVQVTISGSKHIPPPPYMVEKEMENFFIWYEDHKEILHPAILAAEVHQRVVSIHPFIDGNGRTSRLIMNLIMLRHGLVIANIKGELTNRLSYYKALEDSNINQSNEVFIRFILETEINSLKRYIDILGA